MMLNRKPHKIIDVIEAKVSLVAIYIVQYLKSIKRETA